MAKHKVVATVLSRRFLRAVIGWLTIPAKSRRDLIAYIWDESFDAAGIISDGDKHAIKANQALVDLLDVFERDSKRPRGMTQ